MIPLIAELRRRYEGAHDATVVMGGMRSDTDCDDTLWRAVDRLASEVIASQSVYALEECLQPYLEELGGEPVQHDTRDRYQEYVDGYH